jgi:predicted dehydrogenase
MIMIRIALIGCGGMAHSHAQNLQRIPQANIVALVDPLSDRTKHFRERYFHDAAEFLSIEDLFADAKVKLDAVILVTPHYLHYPHIKLSLERGLHVLTEKPMVTNSAHAYDLWQTVKRTGKLLGIAFQSAYTAEFGYLALQRMAGQLGKVQIISGWLSQNWLAGTANTWRQIPEQSGGGQMYDSGSHLLNAIMWIMDEPVVEVGCYLDNCDSPVDINGVAIARFQGGALASITIGGNCPGWKTEILIQTDSQVIATDQYGGKLEINIKDSKRIYPHVQQDLKQSAGGTPQWNFVNAIEGREKLQCTVRNGALVSVLMDALYESARDKRLVNVKPVPNDI